MVKHQPNAISVKEIPTTADEDAHYRIVPRAAATTIATARPAHSKPIQPSGVQKIIISAIAT